MFFAKENNEKNFNLYAVLLKQAIDKGEEVQKTFFMSVVEQSYDLFKQEKSSYDIDSELLSLVLFLTGKSKLFREYLSEIDEKKDLEKEGLNKLKLSLTENQD